MQGRALKLFSSEVIECGAPGTNCRRYFYLSLAYERCGRLSEPLPQSITGICLEVMMADVCLSRVEAEDPPRATSCLSECGAFNLAGNAA